MDWLREFNNNYAHAVSAITPFVIGIISWLYYKLVKESKLNKGDAALSVGPIFWRLRKRYKIEAVHKYEKSDDMSGYKHISQNSRPDQWSKLIEIKQSCLGFRFQIIPKNTDDILTVIISRNGKERWKTIKFNQ